MVQHKAKKVTSKSLAAKVNAIYATLAKYSNKRKVRRGGGEELDAARAAVVAAQARVDAAQAAVNEAQRRVDAAQAAVNALTTTSDATVTGGKARKHKTRKHRGGDGEELQAAQAELQAAQAELQAAQAELQAAQAEVERLETEELERELASDEEAASMEGGKRRKTRKHRGGNEGDEEAALTGAAPMEGGKHRKTRKHRGGEGSAVNTTFMNANAVDVYAVPQSYPFGNPNLLSGAATALPGDALINTQTAGGKRRRGRPCSRGGIGYDNTEIVNHASSPAAADGSNALGLFAGRYTATAAAHAIPPADASTLMGGKHRRRGRPCKKRGGEGTELIGSPLSASTVLLPEAQAGGKHRRRGRPCKKRGGNAELNQGVGGTTMPPAIPPYPMATAPPTGVLSTALPPALPPTLPEAPQGPMTVPSGQDGGKGKRGRKMGGGNPGCMCGGVGSSSAKVSQKTLNDQITALARQLRSL